VDTARRLGRGKHNSRVNATPIWWEVRPVLILDQSDWPAADGSSGITSSMAMDDSGLPALPEFAATDEGPLSQLKTQRQENQNRQIRLRDLQRRMTTSSRTLPQRHDAENIRNPDATAIACKGDCSRITKKPALTVLPQYRVLGHVTQAPAATLHSPLHSVEVGL